MAIKKKGLGKGLDSLIPDNKPIKAEKPESADKPEDIFLLNEQKSRPYGRLFGNYRAAK